MEERNVKATSYIKIGIPLRCAEFLGFSTHRWQNHGWSGVFADFVNVPVTCRGADGDEWVSPTLLVQEN